MEEKKKREGGIYINKLREKERLRKKRKMKKIEIHVDR